MRLIVALALVGCGVPAPTTLQTRAPTSKPSREPAITIVEAQPVDPSTMPTFGKLARIFVTNDMKIAIDVAGVAKHGDTLLPFSEPVDDVVFVKHLSVRPDPQQTRGQLGKLFCARTRTAKLECVADFDTTSAPAPARARRINRFQLPASGPISHIGTAPSLAPWPATMVDRVCALVQTGTKHATSCWLFEDDAARAIASARDPIGDELTALRLSLGAMNALRGAAPTLSSAQIVKVANSEHRDEARIIGTDADIGVSCVLLHTGTLWCVGPGVYGELGDGRLEAKTRASKPLGDATVVDVAAYRHHFCAAVADGRVACWGEIPEEMPLSPPRITTLLPMCTLDRQASSLQFSAARERSRRARDRAKCESGPHLPCLPQPPVCPKTPYVFRHDGVCQEPRLPDEGPTRDNCDRPRWRTDRELQEATPATSLTLKPVYLRGISDAISLTIEGRLCVVHRDGAMQCFD